ncbi:MAG: 3-dehydroquinate synthase, partial [Eggerthellaceae bacterium]|nr:3-dehydroquinate synthase [Eggerthellaceae bacterium]
MPTTKVVVNLNDGTSYDVRIGTGLLDALGAHLEALPALADTGRIALVTDSNVGPLYRPQVKRALMGSGFTVSEITLPAGEATKSPEVLAELWQAFAQLKLSRSDAVVALGGGVVGDVAGFAAATYMRGIPVVQVPTTLLAAVDASVGGKTAVNLPQGKNLVGAFHQPAYVACDLYALASLPPEEWTSGLAEVAKTALITDDESLFWLESHAETLRTKACVADDTATAMEMIARAVVAKADVVGQDPNETKGLRVALNYGHTLAHALEKVLGPGKISHGRAVAWGMRLAAALSVELAGLDPAIEEAQNTLLDELGLNLELLEVSVADLISTMRLDKKNARGDIRM